jgi:phosphocarrier protein HPr
VNKHPPRAATASALLTNAVGLHARPSVKLTRMAKHFMSSLEIALDPAGPWVDAKSPVKIMRVKAPRGATLYIRAIGDDAEIAVATLAALVNAQFGEASYGHA